MSRLVDKLVGHNVLLVFPCAWGPAAVKGTVIPCHHCLQQCWLAPSSSKLLEDQPGLLVLCIPCGQVVAAADDDPKVVRVPGAEYSTMDFEKTKESLLAALKKVN